MSGPGEVIYVAQYGWIMRSLPLAAACMLAIFRPSIVGIWRSEGWLLGSGLAAAYVIVGLAVLEVFIRRTVFRNNGVSQRSMFGRRRFLAYERIREMIIKPGESLTLKAVNSPGLRVHSKEGSPEGIVDAIKPFLNSEIRVVRL